MGVTVSAGDLQKYVLDNIENAIKDGNIKIYYQPIIRTVTGKICAAEVLTRWDDPKFGFLSPASYVSVLDKAEKIHLLDSYVIRKVCADIRKKIDKGQEPFTVSINLTKADFNKCDLFNVFEEAEQDNNISGKYLCLEIGEELYKDSSNIDETLSKLVDRGHEKWLDDFGHGYSSFSALGRQYDVVKFDVRYLHNMEGEELNKARNILAYSINMVKRLKFSSLISGVENEEEYTFFKELGCEMIQGYFFSQPMPLKELDKQGFEVEAIEERDYYNAIGQIEIANSIATDSFGTSNEEAMAVFEYKDSQFTYLYQNEVNKKYLNYLGGLTSHSAERIINQKSGVLQERLRPFIKELEKGKPSLRFSYMYRGNIINLTARFIARNPRNNAFAFATYTSVMHDENRNRAKVFLRAMQEIYSIYDRIDIIDYDDGVIKNSYINTTEYGGISEGITMKEAAEYWCKDIIAPEQREEYLQFIDIYDLKNKIAKLKSKHICKVFRTKMEDGQYVDKEYVLLPINIDGNDMVLAGIINIDLNGK